MILSRGLGKRRFFRDAVLSAAAAPLMPHRYRAALARRAGLRIGDGCLMMGGIDFVRNSTITIGRNVFINYRCYFDASAPIIIGNEVSIGDNVRIITGTHEIGSSERRASSDVAMPVSIGDGSWLGSGVTVLPGVRIGSGCVVGAGAVVTVDCSSNGLYLGVPARRVKNLPPKLVDVAS